jgi:hypothetical protein
MYEITRSDGTAFLFAGTRGNYYELAPDSHIELVAAPVWCRRCGAYWHGEQIETVAEIDQQLADLRNPRSKLYQIYARDYLEECKDLGPTFCAGRIAELKFRRVWREARRSGPKCIECGSADILVLPYNRPVPSPAGPGTVTLGVRGMCSTYFNNWYFTPEGDRIPRDTKPAYWYLPGGDQMNKPGSGIEYLRRKGYVK